MAASLWKSFPCKISEIRLDRTLACGQSFRWKETCPGEWTGVIGRKVWKLRQSDIELFYKVYSGQHLLKAEFSSKTDTKALAKEKSESAIHHKTDIKKLPVIKTENDCTQRDNSDETELKNYLQLDVNLESLYALWAEADDNFREVSQKYTGIRMLRQDPVECLFSFICSSNNNIARITGMVEKLAATYGQKIMELDGQEYFTFPQVAALSQDGVEEKLRSLGFGYRAKYIQASAKYIEANGGEGWLLSLRDMEYREAKAQLMKLCGVGAKVADCVCLFCCDKPGAIPVDTHVWQIASRDYLPKLKQAKSLTDKLYDEIGDHFRKLWGPYAGWAHSVLFTADLRQFKQPKETEDIKPLSKRKIEPVGSSDETKKGKGKKQSKSR